MNGCIEIQFPRPLASVAAIRSDQLEHSDVRREQEQRRMQEQIDAELAQFRTARTALGSACSQLRELQEQFCGEAEQQLIGLAMEVARKVLMQEIKTGRHEVDPIVKQALSRLPGRIDALVHLNPEDLARCELASQDQSGPDGDGVEFVADPGVCRGECFVETAYGTVESSIEGNIAEISKALTDSE